MNLRRTISRGGRPARLLQAVKTVAATLPPGFQETIVFSGTHAPDGRALRVRRPGLRRGEERPDQGLRQPHRLRRRRSSRTCAPRWTTTGTAGLLGLALHPELPGDAVRLRPLQLRRSDRRRLARPGTTTAPIRPARRRTAASISGRLSRLTADGDAMTGTEQVLLEAWGQQFPSHSIGDIHFGDGRRALRQRRRGRELRQRRLRPVRHPRRIPCGDPPAGVGGTQTPPTAEGGALRSQSLLRVEGGPALANGAVLRVDADGNAPAGQSRSSRAATRSRSASSPTGSAIRSASRSSRRPASSGSATSAGAPGRRSTASRIRRDAGGHELRLAVLRGQSAQQPSYSAREPRTSAPTSTRRRAR